MGVVIVLIKIFIRIESGMELKCNSNEPENRKYILYLHSGIYTHEKHPKYW